LGAVPASGAGVLSKLENNLFIPALVMSTFWSGFTVESLGSAGIFLIGGFCTVGLSILIALPVARLCAKDDYTRKIYTYGLSFSNFGFMGNAVVLALFPAVFGNYLVFVLPLWVMIYLWGVPALLIPGKEGEKKSLLSSLKRLVNPMFAAMLVGMILGLTGVPLPDFVGSGLDSLGGCMSPVAMLLTGMTVSSLDLKKTFTDKSVYLASFIRLLAFPAVFMALLWVLPLPADISLCVLCAVAMPLGLSPVVIPAAYGQDTSAAAGMALISHLLSVATIPLVFWVYSLIG
jgi:predicted permease